MAQLPEEENGRDSMLREVREGAGESAAGGDASNLTILARGCDPVMAAKSSEFLPKMLGNVKMIMTTDDEAFLAALKAQKVDVIFFAPGACRFSAAKQPIPGGIETTRGWTLEEYRAAVREHQGEDVRIVETLSEPEIVPLLRTALKLP
mmetsp:Transcript_7601/g.18335  ORF Transcript_7601/g.18335 Transcript_7601/m.18335 type:complete len:149 (-) Transcript_7601:61-507(-)|eukprot:CAMPEP_0180134970 /NCGR_PEP_ID=MMETSP0986-20121125/10519_1 /TAXON_ID=697907 /ORGANISM="non described non described, Strain CCMP2293" /LENGTH=148 /DNA_ID=CAMNT_0022075513 /DNA_START=41 /DNA_END=487 /DNA_ORIENTATION=-